MYFSSGITVPCVCIKSQSSLQTAIHKAALHGHLEVVKYLVSLDTDVQAQDADGWTALHNACSKVRHNFNNPSLSLILYQGYLDIVRYLFQKGGSAEEVNGVHGVDIRSKGGWTPLSTSQFC